MLYSLYLHIPFCSHRCAYCDFNTYANQEKNIPPYVAALCGEATYLGANAPGRLDVHTVFFGGGTPSLLRPDQVALILAALRGAFAVASDAEITLEANPGSVSRGDLQAMSKLGINRISFGVQSTNGEELRMLERGHDYRDVLGAVSDARRAGIDNLNVDLIYGLPEQTLATWQTTVRRILDLRPEHISAYALTLEHGTPFARWTERGVMPAASPDLAADMYEWLSLELEAAGYSSYEISNWARNGGACLHNLQYWRGLPYLGLGAGAHSHAGGYRYSNILGIGSYIDRMRESAEPSGVKSRRGVADTGPLAVSGPEFPFSPATVSRHRQELNDDMAEFMMTGLRLTRDGITSEIFEARFGLDLREQYATELAELTELGLLEWATTETCAGPADALATAAPNQCIRLTRRGRLLGNQVFLRFVQ